MKHAQVFSLRFCQYKFPTESNKLAVQFDTLIRSREIFIKDISLLTPKLS